MPQSSSDTAMLPTAVLPPCSVAPEVLAAQEDLSRLGDRIVELTAHIQVATYHLLLLIREFDERGGWGGGFISCAHWLNWRTGLDLGAAREKVRVARALKELPQIAAAMSCGQVSYSKARALTRVATAENEGGLLEFALAGSAAHVIRLIRAWRLVDRIQEAESDRKRLQFRELTTYTDADGMLVIRGRLDPETGAVVCRALEAASDRLFAAGTSQNSWGNDSSIEQRRADALGLVAECALTANLDPGTRGDRYQVVVHVDAPVLQELGPDEPGRAGMAMFEDAIRVSAETSRRLTCDCALLTMIHGSDGSILDVGRKSRAISPGLRRALNFRDRTCRFPGCGVTVCDGHHLKHWADGGETKLDNLLSLCRRHHTAVHEEGYRVEFLPNGRTRFFHPRGWELEAAPPMPWVSDGSDTVLVDIVAAAGVKIGPWTGSATALSSECDYGLALDLIRPARTVSLGSLPLEEAGYRAREIVLESRA